MILEIDAGNTRLKWRLRNGSVKVASGTGPSQGDWQWLIDELKVQAAPARVCIASVLAPEASVEFVGWCAEFWGVTVEFARSVALCAGVRNGYTEPSQLGVDRWMALLAARARAAGPALVVDAGSAITVDLLDADGQHQGGYIGPGLQLMRRSLGQDTSGVGDIPFTASGLGPGCDTGVAVNAALMSMLVGLALHGRTELRRLAGSRSVTIIVTGGDAQRLCEQLPGSVLVPDLVLDGLALALPDG